MNYARIENEQVQEYPLKELHIINRGHRLEDYVRVKESPKPSINENHQRIREGRPALINGTWTQQWVVDEVTPKSVTMRQARLALLSVGLLDDVEAAVAAAGRQAQIEWEYATEVQRTHPLIAQVQQAQGLTDAEIDALFVAAAGI